METDVRSQRTPNVSTNTNVLTTMNTITGQHAVYTPNKKTAIVLDHHHELVLDDYLYAIAGQIGASNIIAASRLSGQRICVYLKSEEMAHQLTKDQGLDVKGLFIATRKYISSSTKVILSNVLPDIPTDALKEQLNQIGKITSPIKPLMINSKYDDFKHIISFRRIVYIIFNDPANVPTSFQIHHEDTNYTIFLAREDAKCYRCNEVGHLARNCPVPIEHTTQQRRLTSAQVVGLDKNQNNTSTTKDIDAQQSTSKQTQNHHIEDQPQTMQTDSDIIPNNSDLINTKRKNDVELADEHVKTRRTDSLESMSVADSDVESVNTQLSDCSMTDLHEHGELVPNGVNSHLYPMSTDTLNEFMSEIKGIPKQNIPDIVFKYKIENIDALIIMLNDSKKKANRSMQARIKRLKTSLVKIRPKKTTCISQH